MEVVTILGHDVAISTFNNEDEDVIIQQIGDDITEGAFSGKFQVKNNYEVKFKILNDGEYYLNELNKSLEIINELLNEKLKYTKYTASIYQTEDYFDELENVDLFDDLNYYNKAMFEASILDENEDIVGDMITGRYCDIKSVYDEITDLIDEL